MRHLRLNFYYRAKGPKNIKEVSEQKDYTACSMANLTNLICRVYEVNTNINTVECMECLRTKIVSIEKGEGVPNELPE